MDTVDKEAQNSDSAEARRRMGLDRGGSGKRAPRKERTSFRARHSVLALLAEDSRMPASGPVSSMSLA